MPLDHPLSPLGQFCADYLTIATAVASWGKVFLIAALVAGLTLAAVEAWKRFRAPSPAADADVVRVNAAGISITDLAEALRELVKTLATAPVWLALMAVGVFVFWVPGQAVPGKCEETGTYDAWPAPAPTVAPAAAPTAPPR